jgi:hypothetical protein
MLIRFAYSLVGWRADCNQEGRTAALPFRSEERLRYRLWTTDGDSSTRHNHGDYRNREYSRALPKEFHGILPLRYLESAPRRYESL